MKCKFCNSEMVFETKRFSGTDYQIVKCNNHQPSKVTYKSYLRFGDVWKVFYGGYVLSYFYGGTSLQKINKEAKKVSDYYQSIKKFNYELPFAPEEFPNKLKTMLTFL